MANKLSIIILTATMLLLACSGGEQSGRENETESSSASAAEIMARIAPADAEKQIIEQLLPLWDRRANFTNVSQAAAMLDMEINDSIRLELLGIFNENPELSSVLERYKSETFVLTNEEKVLAQYLRNHEQKNSTFPDREKVKADLGISDTELTARLNFLVATGFLFDLGGPEDYNPLGYSYGDRMATFIFDVGLRFHVFYVDDELPFNVGCGKFAMLLTDYPDRHIRYETVDPLTLEPIAVVIDNSELVSLEPETAMFLEGGYCGANNMFVSRENASAWAETAPFVREPKYYELENLLAELKSKLGGEGAGSGS